MMKLLKKNKKVKLGNCVFVESCQEYCKNCEFDLNEIICFHLLNWSTNSLNADWLLKKGRW